MNRSLAVFLSAMVVSVSAFADHGNPGVPGGAVDNLIFRSRDLDRVVQWSSLRWEVKSSVSRFLSTADSLASCFRASGIMSVEGADFEPMHGPGHPGHPGHPGYPGPRPVPPYNPPAVGRCSYEFNLVLSTWSEVERYLYDTNYEFPGVFYEYQRTRDAVNDVRNLGGGSGGGYYPPAPVPALILSVAGYLNGTYFGFSAPGRQGIYNDCVNFGYRFGISVVREVTIDGRRYIFPGYGTSIQSACQMIMQRAR